MKIKDFILGCLGLFAFSVLGFFLFGTLILSLSIPIWIIYYVGWRRNHD